MARREAGGEVLTQESITNALDAAGWNVRKACRALGVTHPTLYKWMRRLHISRNAGNRQEDRVATQGKAQPTMTEAKGRAPRTVYMTDEENQALINAGIDLAFYTRQKQSLSDVVVLLVKNYLPALLRDARKPGEATPAPGRRS